MRRCILGTVTDRESMLHFNFLLWAHLFRLYWIFECIFYLFGVAWIRCHWQRKCKRTGIIQTTNDFNEHLDRQFKYSFIKNIRKDKTVWQTSVECKWNWNGMPTWDCSYERDASLCIIASYEISCAEVSFPLFDPNVFNEYLIMNCFCGVLPFCAQYACTDSAVH